MSIFNRIPLDQWAKMILTLATNDFIQVAVTELIF